MFLLVLNVGSQNHLKGTLLKEWKIQKCGPENLITKWGKIVNPNDTLPEYPRPQLIRNNIYNNNDNVWINLNGLWQFNYTNDSNFNIPFNTDLPYTILVPYPMESCLSGIVDYAEYQIYRQIIDDFINRDTDNTRVLLHFGAIDWKSEIYFNGRLIGGNTGGYNSFSIDITDAILPLNNEIIIQSYDPTTVGNQPCGKQNQVKMYAPEGYSYTPTSGVWQTVWLEQVPNIYVDDIDIIMNSTEYIIFNISVMGTESSNIIFDIYDPTDNDVATFNISDYISGDYIQVYFDDVFGEPKLWSPDNPFLYDLIVKIVDNDKHIMDQVTSYFGVRTITLGHYALSNGTILSRPLLNNNTIFLNGWLDQGFWPDGIYTQPSDEALIFDIKSIKTFGFNMARVHQKINPERYYYYADLYGILLLQDMVQKPWVTPNNTTLGVEYFSNDLAMMVRDKSSHPSIIQWEIFNENDCWNWFPNITEIVDIVSNIDDTRLIDIDSGGNLPNVTNYGDVIDYHHYGNHVPDPIPNNHQYAMVGEYGGIGVFDIGHEWLTGACFAYKPYNTTQEYINEYSNYANQFLTVNKGTTSAMVYTQITDTECECDGLINYDRTPKFNETEIATFYTINQQIINTMWDD